MRRIFAISMVVFFGLAAGCTLNPNTGDDPLDLSITPGDIDVPCDANNDGVTDCILPNECRNAANDGDPVCLEDVGTTCILWDPTNACANPPLPFCGDGVIDIGETCDDGPANSDSIPDACRTTCQPASCGDNIIDTGEVCDDGALNSDTAPDACRTTCVLPSCGDSVVDGGETCDDGPANSDTLADACRTTCLVASCGDDVLDTGEACDDGALNSDTLADACRTTCLVASCGDDVLDTGEACDNGALNSDIAPDACRTTCVVATCGDSVQDTGETCDDGALNSDSVPDACRTTCLVASCGDGIMDTGEGCDDGNVINGDGCSALCVLEPNCPNGVVDSGEDCDGGANCDPVTCKCPADFYPDGALGCSACDVAGVCQDSTNPYCKEVPSCWDSALRVACPMGCTVHLKTGAGLYTPLIIPAGQYRTVGLMGYDLGADFWATTTQISVEVFLTSPNMDGMWMPGVTYPTVFVGPPTLTNLSEFNVNQATPVNVNWSLAP